MTPARSFFVLPRCLWVLAASALLASALLASAPLAAAPPKWTGLFPAGAGRGQETTVAATLESTAWPLQAWVDRPGVTVVGDKTKGKLQVKVAADAAPGLYWIRLFGDEGATSPRPFVVGTLAEIEEREPNDAVDKPQFLDGPTTINGRLTKSDTDGFVVWLRQGQTLVASLLGANVLGSPMDASLQVCSLRENHAPPPVAAGKNGRPKKDEKVASEPERPRFQEAYVLEQQDDSVGLDPRLVFTAPRDGWYLVRLWSFPAIGTSSISLAGGDDFVYRLTLTTGGFLDHALPLAVSSDASTDLELTGWNLGGGRMALPPRALAGAEAAAAATSGPQAIDLFRDDAANVLRLPIVPHANLVADPAKSAGATGAVAPMPIPVPATVSGRIAAPRARQSFRFEAKKGQKLRLTIESRELGFELDPLLIVANAEGVVLQEVDDTNKERDPSLLLAVPADGFYTATVRDLHQHGGLRYAYRLTIVEAAPDFALTLAADAFLLTGAGAKTLELPVAVNRLDGLKESIEITAESLPPGVTAKPVESAATGATAKEVKLTLTLDPQQAKPFQGPIQIVGRTKGEKPRTRVARFTLPTAGGPDSQVWLSVKP